MYLFVREIDSHCSAAVVMVIFCEIFDFVCGEWREWREWRECGRCGERERERVERVDEREERIYL